MADSPKQPTADETLAGRIADAIGTSELVNNQKLPSIRDGLAKGTITATDWKLLAELALPSDTGDDLL